MHEGDTIIWVPGYSGLTQAFKKRMTQMVNSVYFDQFILLCVIINTISLAMENMGDEKTNERRKQANYVFTYIFIVEMILKLYVMGIMGYVRDTMCLFDGIIVLTSVMELLFVSDDEDPNAPVELDPATG